MIVRIKIIIALIIVLQACVVKGQDRFDKMQNILNQLAEESPGLTSKVDLSVSGVTLDEFIRGLAVANNLNISVDPSLQTYVTSNFSNVEVKDVLLFLAKKHNLEMSFIGSIINISSYSAPPIIIPPTPKKLPNITFDPPSSITMDLYNDSLYLVARQITRLTGRNIILSPSLFSRTVSGYQEAIDIAGALEKLAYSNNLTVSESKDGSFLLAIAPEQMSNNKQPNSRQGITNNTTQPAEFSYEINDGKISLEAQNTSIGDIVNLISTEIGKNFFLFDEFKGNTTISVQNVSYDDFLGYVLTGTNLTFKIDNNIYLIGDRNKESLRSTRVFQLHHRTLDKVAELIPSDLKTGVEVKPFPDLNSFILSGSVPRILEIEAFLRDIDRVVPVVMIDVIIVDVKKSRVIETGLKAGLGGGPEKTGGSVYPGVNVQMTAESINKIINGFNGFGAINLGKVTPDFYLSLKLLEENNILKTRSTPKLSALNGNKASMSIGKTEYYVETQNSVIGTQNPQNIVTQQYKSVQADLSLTIIPVVSADGQVTLDIQLLQSDFTGRINPNAPPGSVSRDFKSIIRVKNEEVVILGGLEEELTNDSGSGVPLLSRIPVIKWFFSSRLKEKRKSHLNIMIRPTIIYN